MHSRRTRRHKLEAAWRRQLDPVSAVPLIPSLLTPAELSQLRLDLTKTCLLAILALAVEFLLFTYWPNLKGR